MYSLIVESSPATLFDTNILCTNNVLLPASVTQHCASLILGLSLSQAYASILIPCLLASTPSSSPTHQSHHKPLQQHQTSYTTPTMPSNGASRPNLPVSNFFPSRDLPFPSATHTSIPINPARQARLLPFTRLAVRPSKQNIKSVFGRIKRAVPRVKQVLVPRLARYPVPHSLRHKIKPWDVGAKARGNVQVRSSVQVHRSGDEGRKMKVAEGPWVNTRQ